MDSQSLLRAIVQDIWQKYHYDLSYMKLEESNVAVYDNGKPCTDIDPQEFGGSWTKLKKIVINSNLPMVMEHWKINESLTQFKAHIIGHELSHEIWHNHADDRFKAQISAIPVESSYLDYIGKDDPKYEEEHFCEYLGSQLEQKYVDVK